MEGGEFERREWEVEGWEVLGSRSGFGGVRVRRSASEGGGKESEGVKEVWRLPFIGWEVVVKEAEKVVLVRRVDWDR